MHCSLPLLMILGIRLFEHVAIWICIRPPSLGTIICSWELANPSVFISSIYWLIFIAPSIWWDHQLFDLSLFSWWACHLCRLIGLRTLFIWVQSHLFDETVSFLTLVFFLWARHLCRLIGLRTLFIWVQSHLFGETVSFLVLVWWTCHLSGPVCFRTLSLRW